MTEIALALSPAQAAELLPAGDVVRHETTAHRLLAEHGLPTPG